MGVPDRDEHLSRITTMWTVLRAAHGQSPAGDAGEARGRLLERYAPALRRYLLKVTGSEHSADEVLQDFAVQFLRGGFRHADPARGRFRDYVKTAVIRMAREHRRRAAARAAPLDSQVEDVATDAGAAGGVDDGFVECWREELLARAWEALREWQGRSGLPYHDLLRLRAERPEATSGELAELLNARGGGGGDGVTDQNVRKMLQRARERFAGALLGEVERSLGEWAGGGARERVEQELIELGLHGYCRPALRRDGQGGTG